MTGPHHFLGTGVAPLDYEFFPFVSDPPAPINLFFFGGGGRRALLSCHANNAILPTTTRTRNAILPTTTRTRSHPLGAKFVDELKRRSPAVVLRPLPATPADFEAGGVGLGAFFLCGFLLYNTGWPRRRILRQVLLLGALSVAVLCLTMPAY